MTITFKAAHGTAVIGNSENAAIKISFGDSLKAELFYDFREAPLVLSAPAEPGDKIELVIGSFRDEVAAYITANYPDTHRSASPEEVVQFYFAALTGKKDFTCSYDVLQLPFGDARESYGLNLGTTTIINFAHAHDLAMQYWTVNDEADLAYLASVGADALITDYPDRAAAVLQGIG